MAGEEGCLDVVGRKQEMGHLTGGWGEFVGVGLGNQKVRGGATRCRRFKSWVGGASWRRNDSPFAATPARPNSGSGRRGRRACFSTPCGLRNRLGQGGAGTEVVSTGHQLGGFESCKNARPADPGLACQNAATSRGPQGSGGHSHRTADEQERCGETGSGPRQVRSQHAGI